MSDKLILATGGSQGMGLAICEKLFADGYKVITTFTNDESELAKALQQKFPGIEMFNVDFCDTDATFKFLGQLKERRFHGIVNNATFFEFENFRAFDYAVWHKTMAFNLNAPFFICHELKNSLVDGASIVNISSTDAFVGAYASTAYAASKAALLNLTKSFANNLGSRSIRVNAIAAGWIGDVDMGDSSSMSESNQITPLARMGNPSEIADVVAFLISSNSTFVNGATITVDGGYTGVDVIGKKEAESL
jgi:3-oxoacyl-[acyl-carrier protein] reductase